MKKIIIEGGKRLEGEVKISGSKNSSLPCLFAALLTDEDCVLENVPDLEDIHTTCALLTFLGKKITRNGDSIKVSSGKTLRTEASYELVRRMRASALVLGPLLARMGKASASLPGGCAIGVRPIDIHLSGFESLGARATLSEGMVHLSAKKLKGKKIRLHFASVGATENLLMAAVLAEGETVLANAAMEPEIVDCADFLNEMGADISGAGTQTIRIHGRTKLHGAFHRVIPDRIEASTYLIAAAATKGTVKVSGVIPEHFKSVSKHLSRAGVTLRFEDARHPLREQWVSCAVSRPLKPVSVSTETYPGFPTDVQAQWMALMSLVKGRSAIQETIFENRFLHAAELSRMGARIQIKGRSAAVTGVPSLSGAHVMVSDLRAGAAMVIAGLAAQGKTVVHRIYHLDRGYEHLELKLKKIGAQIRRVD